MVGSRDGEGVGTRVSKTVAHSKHQASLAPMTDTAGRFTNSILDSLSAHVAVLDETGTIIAVNRAWSEFAEANAPVTNNAFKFEGANYLRVCDTADGPRAEEAAALAAGIRAVMRNQQRVVRA